MSSISELSLARRYQALVREYNNRPIVARRNTVPALLKLLMSSEREVRLVAAEVIATLCDHPENPEFMCHEKDFLPTIYNAFQHSESADEELHIILGSVFDSLRVCLEEQQATAADQTRRADGESARIASGRTTRVLKGAGKCRSLTLHVEVAAASDDQEDECAAAQVGRTLQRAELDAVLHTIRGVVSFSVDIDASRCTLYTSTSTVAVLNILSDSGFRARVIEESDFADSSTSGYGDGVFAAARGGYIDSIKQLASSIYRNTLVLHGTDSNTLAARLKQQKEEAMRKKNQKEKSQINSFLSKLTTGWW